MCVPPWLEIIKECSFGDLGSSAVFNRSAIQRPAAYLFLYFSVPDCLAMLFKRLAFALAKPNLEATAYPTAAAHQTPAHKISMCRIHTAKRVASEAGTKQMSFVYLIGICCSPKYLSTKGCSTKTASLIVCFGHFGKK